MRQPLAPILVFAYRRPAHLAQCLEALSTNPEAQHSRLIVFCDGPRDQEDQVQTDQVRAIAHNAEGFRSLEVVTRPHNLGLAENLITGINQVLEESENVIVVEDDLVVSSSFLSFLNDGLELYRDNSKVAEIHGFTYRVRTSLPQSFFLRGADCWGWATWRRSWKQFNADADGLIQQLKALKLEREFDLEGAFPYLKMLKDQRDGRIDSWAVRWHASAYIANMFTLYPGTSLVRNIGLEGSGTHMGSFESLMSTAGDFKPPLLEIEVEESKLARRALRKALLRRNGPLAAILTRMGHWGNR